MLSGRAQHRFADLIDDHVAYDALMERIIRLVDAPWVAWPVVGKLRIGLGGGDAVGELLADLQRAAVMVEGGGGVAEGGERVADVVEADCEVAPGF